MNLSVIIVTYNSDNYIQDCLQSILVALESFNDYEIIIIDNDSLDKTIQIIKQFDSDKVELIGESSNKGYAAALNHAVRKVKFEKILILNPDTVVANTAMLELYKASEDPAVGIAGGKLINPDGTFQLSSRRHFPTLGVLFSYALRLNKIFKKSRFFGKYNYTYLNENFQVDVDSISGACMVFDKEIYNKVGGLDESFFLYFEDTDFCLKIKKLGFKVLYCPKAEILHHNNYSDNYSSKIFYFYESFEKFIYKYKNKICLGLLVYYFAKLIKNIFYLKRRLVDIK